MLQHTNSVKVQIAVGDSVRCKAGNMGLVCDGKVTAIKPAIYSQINGLLYAHETLSISGRLNHANLSWHGEAYADQVTKM